MVIIIRCSVLFTHSHTLFIRCMCNTEGWHTHSSLEKNILCKEWWYYLSSFKSIADRTILKNILSFQQEIRQLVNGKLFSQGGKYTIAKSEFLLEKEWYILALIVWIISSISIAVVDCPEFTIDLKNLCNEISSTRT